jgi:hypothetical protein
LRGSVASSARYCNPPAFAFGYGAAGSAFACGYGAAHARILLRDGAAHARLLLGDGAAGPTPYKKNAGDGPRTVSGIFQQRRP